MSNFDPNRAVADEDPEIARILAMSDEEILAECRARGDDPDENAAKLLALFDNAVRLVDNPCPVCGEPGEFLKGDRVVCSDIACSPLALPLDVWVRLSKAVQAYDQVSSFRAAHAALRAAEDEAARLGEQADVGAVNAAKQAFNEALGRLVG